MKTIINLILATTVVVIMVGCVEEDPQPKFTCDQLKKLSEEAYVSWQLVYHEMDSAGLLTLKETVDWQNRNQTAKDVYLDIRKLMNDCYREGI